MYVYAMLCFDCGMMYVYVMFCYDCDMKHVMYVSVMYMFMLCCDMIVTHVMYVYITLCYDCDMSCMVILCYVMIATFMLENVTT